MSIKNKIVSNIRFTRDGYTKWDFDGHIIEISSRGYNRLNKSFFVGYYFAFSDEPIIHDELFDEDFDVLKEKVKLWYMTHMEEALEKALLMLKGLNK
jgi:hypothetical protein